MQVPLKTTERRRLGADNLLRGTSVQECFITKDGVKECTDGEMVWELVDPDLEVIPNNFLKGSKDLTGTLKLGAAVKTIGKNAFLKTKLTGLDLSDAASLKSIGAKAFRNTRITGTIVTPFNVPTYSKAFPKGVSIVKVSIPGLKECAVAPSGTEPCWELADPGMTDIPDSFLKDNTDQDSSEPVGFPQYETGWMRINGGVAVSEAASFADPAVYAVLIDHANTYGAADLPFEICQQAGQLLPRGVVGDLSGPGPSEDCSVSIPRRKPASLLLMPEFDNRNGVATVYTITNTSDTQDIDVHFVYIGKYGS